MTELPRSEKWDKKEKNAFEPSEEDWEYKGFTKHGHFKSSDLEPPCTRCGFQALGSIYVKQFEKYNGLCRECYENS